MKKNFIKILDNVNTSLLTFNKIIHANRNFTGANFNAFIPDKTVSKREIDLNAIKNDENMKKKVEEIANKVNAELNKPSKISNEHIKLKKNEETNKIVNESFNSNIGTATAQKIEKGEINPIENGSVNIKDDNKKNNINEPIIIRSDKIKFVGKQTKLPVSSFSRALNFGMLGASIITNTIGNVIVDKITFKGSEGYDKYLVNETNAEKLSRTLCRMRGAALKFGQILSTFEDLIIPEPLRIALEKARAEADIMPHSQLMKILRAEYGKNWKDNFTNFEEKPFAAASIGQVHYAVGKNGEKMAIKIQYPGVAQSIDSDLNNIKRLFEYFKIFPKGLYIDELIKNLGNELKMECDYPQEAEKQMLFKDFFKSDTFFHIPEIKKDYCTNLILASEFIEGDNIDELDHYPQSVRDLVGSKILELCLRELFEFNFMQTDPNPANFFYDSKTNKINLIDFGAARRFEKTFVDNYMKIVHAAAVNDKHTLLEYSKRIGFLNGLENEIMREAHAQATLAIGLPFNVNNKDVFDFGNQNLTKTIYKLLPTMLKHRLKAPPTEVYSLHRKLSGAYLICIKLKSRVNSKKMFFDIYDQFYKGRI